MKDGLERHPPDWNCVTLLSPGDRVGSFFYFYFFVFLTMSWVNLLFLVFFRAFYDDHL